VSDTSFEDAGVEKGWVVTVGNASLEVLELFSAGEASVSRPRATDTDPQIPPGDITNATVWVVTYRPQIRAAHEAILAMVGLSPSQSDAVLNVPDVRRAETLGALALVFHLAGFNLAPSHPMNERARHYSARANACLARLGIQLDLDGDAQVDACRRPRSFRLFRA
jgi:hypothetical protein